MPISLSHQSSRFCQQLTLSHTVTEDCWKDDLETFHPVNVGQKESFVPLTVTSALRIR